jgi:hypothetical protein
VRRGLRGGALVLALAAMSAPAGAQGRRCEVSTLRGAASLQGAVGTMTVANDGEPCGLMNDAAPGERRNPATHGAVTRQPPARDGRSRRRARAVHAALRLRRRGRVRLRGLGPQRRRSLRRDACAPASDRAPARLIRRRARDSPCGRSLWEDGGRWSGSGRGAATRPRRPRHRRRATPSATGRTAPRRSPSRAWRRPVPTGASPTSTTCSFARPCHRPQADWRVVVTQGTTIATAMPKTGRAIPRGLARQASVRVVRP